VAIWLPTELLSKPPLPIRSSCDIAVRQSLFDRYDEMDARIDDPNLNVNAGTVLVLRNAGPKGAPGMPEWGNLPIPQKLLRTGVRDS
jgi:dihydroxyacid dehydratase/phosphogluconate dehydratase